MLDENYNCHARPFTHTSPDRRRDIDSLRRVVSVASGGCRHTSMRLPLAFQQQSLHGDVISGQSTHQ